MASFFNFAAGCAVTAGSVFLGHEFINKGCYGYAFLTFWFGLDLTQRIVRNETKSNITVEFDEKSKNTKKKQNQNKDNNLSEAQKDNNLNEVQDVDQESEDQESDAQHNEVHED